MYMSDVPACDGHFEELRGVAVVSGGQLVSWARESVEVKSEVNVD
jgi:hypothetical protein